MKGSESGIAGASRTIRHVPEFIRIAHRMKQLCPKAVMLNVTNPLTALTRCVQKYENVTAVGFCHGIRNHLEILLPYFGADSFEGVSFSVSGVDHCSFLTDIRFHGKDALQIMRDKQMIEAAWAGKDNITFDDPFAGRENERIRLADANAERVNIPANPRHYWRYRMHLNLEDLLTNRNFTKLVSELVNISGRGVALR